MSEHGKEKDSPTNRGGVHEEAGHPNTQYKIEQETPNRIPEYFARSSSSNTHQAESESITEDQWGDVSFSNIIPGGS